MMRPVLLWLCLAPVLPASTVQITVAGLGGEPDYEQRFTALAQEAHKLAGGAAAGSSLLTGKDATKAQLKAAIEKAAGSLQAQDALVVLLIGHGTFDGVEYKFNVVGPDVTPADLRAWLDRVPCAQLVVAATSSSGGALAALQKPNRAVVTATRSGNERLAVVFARYWVEALRDPSADADKSNSVSALEAFRFADARVTRYYESQKRVATEHALLEDTGSGDGVRAPSAENGRGLLAGGIQLVRLGALQASLQTPEKQALLAKKETVQQAIDRLKYEKAALPAAEYQSKLRVLLVELAQLEEQLEQ